MARRARRTARGQSAPAQPAASSPRPGLRWFRIVLAVVASGIACVILVILWPTANNTAGRSESRPLPARGDDTSDENSPTRTESDERELVDSLESELQLLAERRVEIADSRLDFQRLEQEITAAADELIAKYATDFQAVHLGGTIYARYKQTGQAEPLLRRSLDLAPGNVQIRQDLANVLLQLGRDDEAAELLAEVITAAPDFASQPDFVNAWAESLIGIGNLQAARELLLPAVQSQPDFAKNWISLGKLQLQSQEYAAAETSLRRALEIDASSELAWLSLCQSLAFQRKNSEAQEARQRLETIREKNLQQQGDFEAQHLPALRRFAASSFRSLAQIHQNHGDSDAAKRWLDRSLEIEPSDVRTWSVLMSYYRHRREFAAAADACLEIIQLQPEVFANYVNLANLNMEMSNVSRAEAALRLAARRNLGEGQAQLSLAQFMLLLNRPSDAVEPARAAVTEMGSIDARFVLISALQATRQFDEAHQELVEVQRLAPNDPRLQNP